MVQRMTFCPPQRSVERPFTNGLKTAQKARLNQHILHTEIKLELMTRKIRQILLFNSTKNQFKTPNKKAWKSEIKIYNINQNLIQMKERRIQDDSTSKSSTSESI